MADEFARQVDEERRALGLALRRAREAVGLTQRDAARALGLSQSALSRFEAGDRGMEVAQLNILARVYGKPLGDLLADAAIAIT